MLFALQRRAICARDLPKTMSRHSRVPVIGSGIPQTDISACSCFQSLQVPVDTAERFRLATRRCLFACLATILQRLLQVAGSE